jgi:hypothetical protein
VVVVAVGLGSGALVAGLLSYLCTLTADRGDEKVSGNPDENLAKFKRESPAIKLKESEDEEL